MKYKKFLFFILIALITCSMCGCANATYTYAVGSDYILQTVNVDIDAKTVNELAEDYNNLCDDIDSYASTYYEQRFLLFKAYISKLLSDNNVSMNYATDIHNAVEYNFGFTNEEKTNFIYQLKFNDFASSDSSIIIPAKSMMNLFYGYNVDSVVVNSKVENSIERKTFTIDAVTTEPITGDNDALKSDFNKAITYFKTKYNSILGNVVNDAEFYFEYATPYSRVHSNSNTIYYKDGFYIHNWKLTSLDDSVTIYRTYANISSWYLVAFACAFAIIIIMALIHLVKTWVKKSKSTPQENTATQQI